MEYILMHRETPVLSLNLDEETSAILQIGEVFSPERIPVGCSAVNSPSFRSQLNRWFALRSIPPNRSGFRDNIEKLEAEHGILLTSQTLVVRCFGLSLSDQYWINPIHTPLEWSKVNFYNNPFSDDIGNILFGEIPDSQLLNMTSPCNTSDGWLQKKWKILDGQRILIKGGSGAYQQEPFNEVLAANICNRLGIPCVDYTLLWEKDKPYCACGNMTTDREDFVSAGYINRTLKKANHHSAYEHFIACCEQLGIPEARHRVNQMLVVDYLINNADRHFGNFGAIRDAVTLEWKGIAPVFDSGSSLWHHTLTESIVPLQSADAKPFRDSHDEQIRLIKGDTDWLDFDALDGLKYDCLGLFEDAVFSRTNRGRILADALERRCHRLRQIIENM